MTQKMLRWRRNRWSKHKYFIPLIFLSLSSINFAIVVHCVSLKNIHINCHWFLYGKYTYINTKSVVDGSVGWFSVGIDGAVSSAQQAICTEPWQIIKFESLVVLRYNRFFFYWIFIYHKRTSHNIHISQLSMSQSLLYWFALSHIFACARASIVHSTWTALWKSKEYGLITHSTQK